MRHQQDWGITLLTEEEKSRIISNTWLQRILVLTKHSAISINQLERGNALNV